jgi:hypothetical protein
MVPLLLNVTMLPGEAFMAVVFAVMIAPVLVTVQLPVRLTVLVVVVEITGQAAGGAAAACRGAKQISAIGNKETPPSSTLRMPSL